MLTRANISHFLSEGKEKHKKIAKARLGPKHFAIIIETFYRCVASGTWHKVLHFARAQNYFTERVVNGKGEAVGS